MSELGQRYEWSPQWARHVQGWYHDRVVDPETGIPEEAPVGATCTMCGETFERKCMSGAMREWIARFSRIHLHRHPLDEVPPKEAT